MKKSELRKIIKEEIQKVLEENTSDLKSIRTIPELKDDIYKIRDGFRNPARRVRHDGRTLRGPDTHTDTQDSAISPVSYRK